MNRLPPDAQAIIARYHRQVNIGPSIVRLSRFFMTTTHRRYAQTLRNFTIGTATNAQINTVYERVGTRASLRRDVDRVCRVMYPAFYATLLARRARAAQYRAPIRNYASRYRRR
jgi:hypothetical protein